MKRLLALLVVNLGLLPLSPLAQALPKVECWAWYNNPNTEEFQRTPLKQASYDPQFYEAKIQPYSYGADYSYLPEEGIGLIIVDDISGRAASSTTGFRRIAGTKIREANLKFYDRRESGETVVASINCSYQEP